MKKTKTIEEVINQVLEACEKAGISVNVRDAVNSNSVYLLFDYGMLQTMRVSDHGQSRHQAQILKYRYNIVLGSGGFKKETCTHKGKERIQYFCSERDVDMMIAKLLRQHKKIKDTVGELNYMDSVTESRNSFPERDRLWYRWEHHRRGTRR